jgi:hypothetical protein
MAEPKRFEVIQGGKGSGETGDPEQNEMKEPAVEVRINPATGQTIHTRPRQGKH